MSDPFLAPAGVARVTAALPGLTARLQADVPLLQGAFPDFESLIRQLAAADTRRSVYLLGTIKSGKSTLVNALIGRDVMPRGAGVKTFNLTRARVSPTPSATVLFHSGPALRDRIEFDFRLLGFDWELPEAPYSEAGTAALAVLLEDFERACREDERLLEIDADGSLLDLLPRSLARIRRTVAGLVELQARRPAAQIAQIAEAGRLVFEAERFDAYRDWMDSMDLAALIRGIELGMPWPEVEPALPTGVELIDCQGSDSLNPLDFADVESIVERADLIVYVIQSRLGLRQGDRDLLRHLAQAGASQRIQPVVNVDGFDPLLPDEFTALLARVRSDLQRTAGATRPLLPLCSLAELDRMLDDGEELQMMNTLWRRRDASGVWAEVVAGARVLRQELFALGAPQAAQARDLTPRLRALLRRGHDTAKELLIRDQRVLGTDASGMPRAEAVASAQRIVDGERQRIREDAAREVDAALADDGLLQRELDEFLDGAGTRYLRQRPVPEALLAETRPTRVIDAALAVFNADWLGPEGTQRRASLAGVRRWLAERLAAGLVRIERMLPPTAQPEQGDAVRLRSDPERAVAEVTDGIAAPTLLVPVALPGALRQALAAEFMSRGLLGRMRGVRGEGNAAEVLARRVETLWRRTLAAAFRQAQDDRAHAVANARENYKFQYCYRIADQLMARVAAEVLRDVEGHHARLARLAEARRLLLDDGARQAVEAYLLALDALALELDGEASAPAASQRG